jgi:hypothetical protein
MAKAASSFAAARSPRDGFEAAEQTGLLASHFQKNSTLNEFKLQEF